MAVSGDPTWLADALRAEGVKVVEWSGKDNAGKPYDWKSVGNGGTMGTLWGAMFHHTGGGNSPVSEIRFGTSSLRGLLSQIHLAKDGTATVCGVGPAYHAGLGSYPGVPTNNGNSVLIGVEMVNDGYTPYPIEQWDAAVKIGAAISRKLGVGADRNIAHREYAGAAQGKWDPSVKLWDMAEFRRQVAARLAKPASPTSTPGVKTVSDTDILRDIRAQLTGSSEAGKYPGWKQLGNRTLVDALAAIGEKLGIEGFKAP